MCVHENVRAIEMELEPKANSLVGRTKDILREEGLLPLIKRAFLFFVKPCFSYQTCYIYENNLSEVSGVDLTPRIQNLTFKIINASQQIDELVAEGYDFSSAPNIVNFNPERRLKEVSIENFDFRGKLGGGGILFCGFINRVLVHTNWIAMDEKTNMAPFLSRIDWRNEVCLGPSYTNPEYRRLGINTYVYSQMYQFLKEKGRAKAKLTTGKSNIAHQQSQAKLGSTIMGEGKLFKIFLWKFYTVKPTKEI